MSTNEQQQNTEQLTMLKERFPHINENKLTHMLQRHGGDFDKVCARLSQREARCNKWESLETRFGPAITTLQQEHPSIQSCKRFRLLKTMERFDGDLEKVNKFIQDVETKHCHEDRDTSTSRCQRREELKTKYASQLAQLATSGINVDRPWVLRLLEKHEGDVNKAKFAECDTKYANQIAQLEAEGFPIKNKRILARLLEKSNGDIDVVKQLVQERQEKHLKRKEHRSTSPAMATQEDNETCRKRHDFSSDDLENLKKLRLAGVHGNPRKVLATFHECNGSIELTQTRMQEKKDKRCHHREERASVADIHNAYITINQREDWPRDIEQVYLDGNNMMFVVDSLRRLCLNRAGKKTERAIGEVAAAWNQQMHIPNVELIYDLTRQLDQIDTVKVTSAQPTYKTTDDMLVDIVRRPENHEKNKRTIVITSDRALAVLLQREGCLLVKPKNWFAHCIMVLTPDLINNEETTGMITNASPSSSTTVKTHFNFDELVRRIAKIDI
ncbi:unnamed protein product [Adineta steineri]|uniref:CUE domain-containing protein n=1 Tax=Adineta steineri TaxID=433720 RepID=A0A815SG45_9BILA|nr:unnamed protein product [Adineta steineri]CAF1489750.1 unnamed protein product [Adineta steineri]